MTQNHQPPRFPAVDILRGLCIVNVVIHHTNIRIAFNRSPVGAMLPEWLNRFLFWTGDYSVKVFFVISGFLITTSILSRWQTLDRVQLADFYRRRVARIAPLLLAVLAVLTVLQLLHVPGFTIAAGRASLPRALLAALTFHINWLEATTGYLPGAWDVLWSLSVEETFYLIYPLLCRFAPPRILGAVAAALLIAGPFGRTRLAFNDIWSDYSWLAGMDAIAMGCIAAVIHRRGGTYTRVAGAVLLCAGFFRQFARAAGLLLTGLDVTVLAIGTALILVTLDTPTAKSRFRILQWFGRNSYEVYLTHMFVVTAASQAFIALGRPVNSAPLWFVLTLSLSGLLGHFVAVRFSTPMRRLLID